MDCTWNRHSHTPHALQGWCHDRTGNGDGAARPSSAVQHSVRTILGSVSMALKVIYVNRQDSPTCSAFSQLRLSFEALSESGKRSSSPARPNGS
jgi:hypothetical protein